MDGRKESRMETAEKKEAMGGRSETGIGGKEEGTKGRRKVGGDKGGRKDGR